MRRCLFVELFSCIWPAAQDSGQEQPFSSDGLVCSGVCRCYAVSHFVLEKSRLVGRKERGMGVAGGAGVGAEGVAIDPEEV